MTVEVNTIVVINNNNCTLGPSWSYIYGSRIYNYLCNQCLSPLKLWVWIPLMTRCSRYNFSDSLSVTCTRNRDNVSEWSDMSTRWLLFQWANTVKIQLSVFFWNKPDIIIISLNVTCSCHDFAEKIAHLALNNDRSLTHSL